MIIYYIWSENFFFLGAHGIEIDDALKRAQSLNFISRLTAGIRDIFKHPVKMDSKENKNS